MPQQHDRIAAWLLLAGLGLAVGGCGTSQPKPAETPASSAKTSSLQTAPRVQPSTATTPATRVAVPTPPPVVKLPPKILLMHYMSWYETPAVRGAWGKHWTGFKSPMNPDQLDANGLPTIWSHYHPLIGLYDSSDPDALECHLLQMKLAGVDGVIVDWYGISKAESYPNVHVATAAMMRAAGHFGMKFAVCFEDRTVQMMIKGNHLKPEETKEHLTSTVAWLQENWFNQPQYFRIENRPLFMNFGPIFIKDASIWDAAMGHGPDRPAFYALHHLWKAAGADGGFTWVHSSVWKSNPDDATVQQRLQAAFANVSPNPQQVIVSALPGFKDIYEKSYPTVEHRDGKTMQETLQAGLNGPWPIIQLVTWNDYGEGTMIEPTHEFGYRFLEIVQQNHRQDVGESFRFTAEDLRLPARLYALRKAGKVQRDVLDAISDSLNRGECGAARQALAGLAP